MAERSGGPRVFVSHSHQDNDFCRRFVARLRKTGCEVWYDEHNLGWGQLRQIIDRELRNCDHFIVILSPDAVDSDWVNMEIDAALALLHRKKLQTFVLVVARKCDIPVTLEGYKRVEGSYGTSVAVEDAVHRVSRIIQDAEAASPVLAASAIDRRPKDSGIQADNPGFEVAVTSTVELNPAKERNTSNDDLSSVATRVSSTRVRPDNAGKIGVSPKRKPLRIVLRIAVLLLVMAVVAVAVFGVRHFVLGPTASFSYSSATRMFVPSVGISTCIDFDGSSSSGISLKYMWDFGDSGSGYRYTAPDSDTSAHERHCYVFSGAYTVTLTVQDGSGNRDATQQIITI